MGKFEMSEQQNNRPKDFNRVLAVGFVLALSAGNSALFYFVIWDMLSPSEPFSVILFFVSGSAHLAYFFLPWFAKEMLAPLFRPIASDSGRNQSGNNHPAGEASMNNGFVNVCAMFGMLLCTTAIGLWSLQSDLWRQAEPNMAMITEANCLQIEGEPKLIDGKLICVIEQKRSEGADTTRVDRRQDRS